MNGISTGNYSREKQITQKLESEINEIYLQTNKQFVSWFLIIFFSMKPKYMKIAALDQSHFPKTRNEK